MTTPPQTPPDAADEVAALLAAAAGGEEEAWRRVVGLYAPRVFALALSRVRSREMAEEVTQSVFVTVAGKIGRGGYAERGKFEPWLFRIAMNRVRDEARRARRQASPAAPGAFDSIEAGGGISGSDRGALDRLREAVKTFSGADREVVELRHHAGLSFKQMAELLDEPVGTLLARHHRALRKLKEVLGGSAAGAVFEDVKGVQ